MRLHDPMPEEVRPLHDNAVTKPLDSFEAAEWMPSEQKRTLSQMRAIDPTAKPSAMLKTGGFASSPRRCADRWIIVGAVGTRGEIWRKRTGPTERNIRLRVLAFSPLIPRQGAAHPLARCWRGRCGLQPQACGPRLFLPTTLVSFTRWGILASMGDGGAILSIVQSGAIWRVRIAWPNYPARYFGKFNSETEAQKWIAAHDSLTKQPSQPFVESPPIISDPNASRE